MNGNNKYNVLTEDDINDLLTYNMNTYYLMDEFHHDSDDEDILIVTYYLSTTDDSECCIWSRGRDWILIFIFRL